MLIVHLLGLFIHFMHRNISMDFSFVEDLPQFVHLLIRFNVTAYKYDQRMVKVDCSKNANNIVSFSSFVWVVFFIFGYVNASDITLRNQLQGGNDDNDDDNGRQIFH